MTDSTPSPLKILDDRKAHVKIEFQAEDPFIYRRWEYDLNGWLKKEDFTDKVVFQLEPKSDENGLVGEIFTEPEPPQDEYHTMSELYNYRMLYNAHAILAWQQMGIDVVKSYKHHDGEPCFNGEYFIVSAQLPTGQVSNHYTVENWHLFICDEVETAPEWDGHTPDVAAQRMWEWLIKLEEISRPDVAFVADHGSKLLPETIPALEGEPNTEKEEE